MAAYIEKFDELTQLEDREQFVQDLVDECAWARAFASIYLIKGTRTKPNEWTTQILASGLAKVMRQHGLKVAISEYFDRHHEWRQSLYLRLIPGLVRIAGFPVPKYVKGLALRAKRINHEGVIRTQIKRRRRSRPIQVVERFPPKKTIPEFLIGHANYLTSDNPVVQSSSNSALRRAEDAKRRRKRGASDSADD